MPRDSLNLVAGLLVMAAGIFVLLSPSNPDALDSETAVTEVASGRASSDAAPGRGPGDPRLPGLPDAVELALFDRGGAETLDRDELTGLGPSVRRVLSSHDEPLLVAESSDRGERR
jgi:hypothetical protein